MMLGAGFRPTPVNDTITLRDGHSCHLARRPARYAIWEAVAIVLGVSLISLGLRAGAVVAVSIPLVLAAVFMSMEFLGIDLQRISLGALIIALGLLVDDAMITVEMMVTHLEHGEDKESAATYAYKHTAFPMLTGTLVTVAGFVPIGFARSAAGEYTFSIFAVVAIALIISWIVAVLFAPLLGVWMLKKPKAAHSAEPGPIMRAFRHFLVLAMRARWVTILLTLGLFGAALYGMRLVPQQFFPSSDRPELLVDLQLPENASIYATREVSARVDKLLKGDPDVDHSSTYVGEGAVRFYLPLNVQLPNDFFAQLVVVTKGLKQRERVKAKLEQALANQFPSVVGRVYPLELGPPVGWPLQYRVSGPEPSQVRDIAFRVADVLGSDPGARNINYNWMEPARTVRIKVDQDQARLLGLSSEDLARSLNTVVTGVTATQMRSGIYLVDVLVRASADQRMSLGTIRTLQVPLSNGHTVPLSQIASVEYGALIGGGTSMAAAVYTQRYQERLQRVASEITKREMVCAEFIMNASNWVLNAYVRDEIALNADEQRLIGLVNRMRLFAPPSVVAGAEAVLKAIIEIALKPGVNVRQLAKEALSKNPESDPLLAFSQLCRADLDNVRRTVV
jgi:multidrug efflux pump